MGGRGAESVEDTFCKNCTKCSDIQIAQMGGFINEVGDSIKYCADFVKKICILKFKKCYNQLFV